MARWTHTLANEKYAVVIYNYESTKQYHLCLEVGEVMFILRQLAGWYYGYSLRQKDQKGIFPQSHVVLKDASIYDSGFGLTHQNHEYSLADEISSVLREWSVVWKRYFVQCLMVSEDVHLLYNMMLKLAESRMKILSKKLPQDELKALKQSVAYDIDIGNKKCGLDFVVRDDAGNVLDPLATSAINLFRQHQIVASRISNEKQEKLDSVFNIKFGSHSILVSIKNVVCKISEEVNLLFSLYDAKNNSYITENYVVHWEMQSANRHAAGLSQDLDVLFTDLGQKDTLREKVFIVCQIIRIGVMNVREAETKKLSRDIKRPFGVAALDITELISSKINLEKDNFMPIMLCGDNDSIDAALKKILFSKEPPSQRDHGVWLTVRKLFGDAKHVIKEYPHLVSQSTVIAKKMGFPDIVLPGEVRNDLYVTLCEAEFRKGLSFKDKNIEVTAVVCTSSGQIMQNVIVEGAGRNEMNVFKSIVYYHDDKPKWNETFKVSLPIPDFIDAHLKFTFKHRASTEAKDKAEKVLAVAYITLMQANGTTLPDGLHHLAIYRIDNRRTEESSSIYLKLPSAVSELQTPENNNHPDCLKSPASPVQNGPFKLSGGDSFTISTLLCSTKLASNINLLRLMKWRDHPDQLKNCLLALMKVDGDEVVKFLEDVLDVLFNILMQYNESDQYDSLVFDALNYVVGIVLDRKYLFFKPLLDDYITNNFSATLAYNKLLAVLKNYISSTVRDQKFFDILLKTLKSYEYIIKFVVRSRVLFAALNNGRGKQQFDTSIMQVFELLNSLMKDNTEISINAQSAALKYLPVSVADLLTIFDVRELAQALISFIQSMPPKRLVKQKLQFINDIIQGPLFLIPEGRSVIILPILEGLKRLLEDSEELEMCAMILSNIVDIFYQFDAFLIADDVEHIVMTIFRTVIQVIIETDHGSEATIVGNFVAILISMLRQMDDHHYSLYLSHFDTNIDLLDFLMEILMVFRDLTSKTVFSSDWADMILLQTSTFVTALKHFARTIAEKFLNPFEYQVWNNYFHCAIAFVTQDCLQLENWSSTKRNKIILKYGDMRRQIVTEITKMWHKLGVFKIEFIPELVGPFLELTLIPETELRKESLPLFYDMMQCEFRDRSKYNFRFFENELITKLDLMIEGGKGDEMYCDVFRSIMVGCLDTHNEMRKVGTIFVETVCQLIHHLLEYRAVIVGDNLELKITSTVNLLSFYESLNRQEIYVRYLHKLCDFHLSTQNFTEAACTMQLYARLLKWSDEEVPLALQSSQFSDTSSQRELKMKLYHSIINYFDKGQMWENGIEMCKELAEQYEKYTFDYLALSAILQKEASFYDHIMKESRGEPCYFRVAYYGLGFPSFLQNKSFVYRGSNWERLSDFTANVQSLYPNAKLLSSLSPPDDATKFSDGQFLQVNAVMPVMELPLVLQGRKLHEQIVKYYQINRVQKFMYARKKDESTNDIMKLWLEKTYLTISNPLPSILRWYPIIKVETVDVSPIENAIETIEGTNQKLHQLIREHTKDPTLRVDPLGMVLNGVVDAAVNGGIANYKPFYLKNYVEKYPAEEELVKQLRQLTVKQLVLVQSGLDIHRQRAPESLLPFQARMDQRFNEMKAYMEADYDIKLTDDVRTNVSKKMGIPLSVKRNKTMPSQQRIHEDMQIQQGAGNEKQRNLALPTVTAYRLTPTIARAATTVVSRDSSAKTFSRVPNLPPSSVPLVADSNKTTSPASVKSEQIIELTEQLTPKRPPRPASNKTGRLSLEFFDTPPSSTSVMVTKEFRASSEKLDVPLSKNETNDAVPVLPHKQPRRFLTVQVQKQDLAFLNDSTSSIHQSFSERPTLPQKRSITAQKSDSKESEC